MTKLADKSPQNTLQNFIVFITRASRELLSNKILNSNPIFSFYRRQTTSICCFT